MEAARSIDVCLSAQGSFQLLGSTSETALTKEASTRFVQEPLPRLLVSVQPAEIREQTHGRYGVTIRNPGTPSVAVRLSGEDSLGNLDFQFAPPELILPAQCEKRAAQNSHHRDTVFGSCPELTALRPTFIAGSSQEDSR